MADGPKKTGNKVLDAGLAHAWEHYFDGMVADIEAGKKPDWRKLERGLRSGNPIPRVIRDFVADVLVGKIKRPRGAPPDEFPEMKRALYQWEFNFQKHVIEVWEQKRGRKWGGKTAKRSEALERAAGRCKVDRRTIERALSRGQ